MSNLSWFFLSLIPLGATVVGAGISIIRPPNAFGRSVIQHLAAGVIFSVVSVELLPDVIKRHQPFYVVLGFLLGIVAMSVIKSFTGSATGQPDSKKISAALITAICVDILLDGFLIGIGRAAGEKEGLLLTSALTIELLSLGLAVAIEFKDGGLSSRRTLASISAIALLLPVGAGVGTVILSHAPDSVMETVLSFGLVALLFLVTEELLTEAHEQPETPLATASFFVGFLLFLIMGMLT